MPFVEVDHIAVSRLAAEHFLERGFVNFGYFAMQPGKRDELVVPPFPKLAPPPSISESS